MRYIYFEIIFDNLSKKQKTKKQRTHSKKIKYRNLKSGFHIEKKIHLYMYMHKKYGKHNTFERRLMIYTTQSLVGR